jgi:radical SAM-linked protein
VDFELKAEVQPEEFRHRLAAQLPDEIPIYQVEEVPLSSPSATKSLQQAEYVLRLAVESATQPAPRWTDWIEAVKAKNELLWEKTTKSGKVKTLNLKEWLYQLDLVSATDEHSAPQSVANPGLNEAVVTFTGSSRNDGTLLRPEQVAWMLSQVAQQPVEVRQVHRQRLIFKD